MSDETPIETPDENVEEVATAEVTPAATDETETAAAAADEAPAAEAKPKAKAKAKPKETPEPVAADEASPASSGDEADSSAEDDSEELTVDHEAELAAAKAKLLKPGKGARYAATGKRKRSVARVILTPGTGSFWINGRDLKTYFPRAFYQGEIMEPLELTGAAGVYDVRARIHGGGITGQSHALRHGIAKALAEVDPAIRTQVKSKGMLKVDTRQVERKKAGLKKARKKPQFSKR
jgi:small subunit ribosomal protein S9